MYFIKTQAGLPLCGFDMGWMTESSKANYRSNKYLNTSLFCFGHLTSFILTDMSIRSNDH